MSFISWDDFIQSVIERERLIKTSISNDPIAEAMIEVGIDPGIEESNIKKEQSSSGKRFRA